MNHMKNFDYTNLKASTQIIKSVVVGQYINRFYPVSDYDFFFALSQKNSGLFISLNNANPFIDYVGEKVLFPKSDKQSHLHTIINHHLEKAKIVAFELQEGQKIVKLTLEKYYENLSVKIYYMFIELVVAHPNLIVTDCDNHIVSIYRASKDFSEPRILRISQPYKLPFLAKPFSAQESSVNLGQFTRDYLLDFAFVLRRNNHPKLYKHIRSTIKRLENKKEKISQDLANLIPSDEAVMFGNLLLTLKPNITSNQVTIEDQLIIVDPTLDAIQNANSWFKKAKKARLSYLSQNNQLKLIDEELQYYYNLQSMIDNYDENELQELAVELGITGKRIKNKNQTPTFKPYYIMYNNTKIGFGKNNLQNDYLSFKLANKNDIFMHIKGQHGAHIVIFDAHPNDDVLQFAAQFGLYLASVPSAEFSYTLKKHVKKAGFPGSVILEKEQTLFVKADPKLIQVFIDKIKRF